MYITAHRVSFQETKPFNLKRRFRKNRQTLLEAFGEVKDGRCNQGKRHPLTNILTIVFCEITSGSTTLKDIHKWGYANARFLKRFIDIPHGIPDPTTLSRALQIIDIDGLIHACLNWSRIILGETYDGAVDELATS